jgi:hypothetical protein
VECWDSTSIDDVATAAQDFHALELVECVVKNWARNRSGRIEIEVMMDNGYQVVRQPNIEFDGICTEVNSTLE